MASKKKLRRRIKYLQESNTRLLKLGRKYDPKFGQLYLRDLIPTMRATLGNIPYKRPPETREDYHASGWNVALTAKGGNLLQGRVEFDPPPIDWTNAPRVGVVLTGSQCAETDDMPVKGGPPYVVLTKNGPVPSFTMGGPIEPPCCCWNPFHPHEPGGRALDERIRDMFDEHDQDLLRKLRNHGR